MNKVIIFAENFEGVFKKATFEAVSYGSRIVEQMGGGEVIAISLGEVADEELKSLGDYGATRVISLHNEAFNSLDAKIYAKTIADNVKKENAGLIIFTDSNASKAVAPRVAVRLHAGMVFGAYGLPSNLSPFTIPKKVFYGKAFTEVVIQSEVKVISLSQNSFGVVENKKDIVVENIDHTVDTDQIKTKILSVEKSTGKILLTDAEIVVSGGRGMKGPDKWKPLEDLAETLGAGLACTRPVSDEGWRPHTEHVGQTGKIIAPNLYFAFGISGAIQHLAGVSSSKVIVAVNTDKDAPIFSAADYGVVGDAATVLIGLNDALKKFKSEN
ncbi:MAG TPA: electron transfer flavoprotein subunit alpha/FixB family protein [Bacteroidales bacterium]|nr:electron transfer flavoprotein subunit alpha/FixB family protein [Bacteroidales bacterium]HOG66336.1 electron transfer flavoprotein subunit alpha/FixB family protein [Bacteroidales bacterium]HPA12762.1 electron transfer flavoprotein subunit alpha/FixB family protein [Bacteroidales bacterium]HQF00836.1 electron transfer flavoprotein subunit alpha/FixB family protein [Bacteroidales bacterium]HQH13983.1 electron transfer flavoprotein subunit alpha/FixB family protein [Bacteroidales bacterium]